MKIKFYLFYTVLALSGFAHAQENQAVEDEANPSRSAGSAQVPDGKDGEKEADPAQSIDVLLSNRTIEARYLRDVKLFGANPQTLLIDGFLNSENSFQFVGGLSGDVLNDITPLGSNFKITIGSRFYISRLADPSDNVFGLGFGAGWSYMLPGKLIKIPFPLTVRGNYYYAPEVLTSGDSQDIVDFDIVEVQLGLTENLAGIFGLRELSVADRNLDNTWDVGVRYEF